MTLQVQVYGRNMEVTDRIEAHVQKKTSKLDRYLNGIEEVRVDLAYVKSARSAADRQVAQITIHGKGFLLRSEERADDIYAALDTAVDKIQRQMERYKGKRQRGRGDGKSAAEVVPPVAEVEEAVGPEIVRRKKFALAPMDEAEAMEQMSLLSHEDFFIFYNSATNAVNVLYRRRDGSYGLIETETR
ncbi:MAG TPA: ribosome-associated translation inhibitor RaiA [Anaerolineales bacterium]|nr:ribosome-associated translation inhibitor RaiA [Anaerolineales bacterium]